jgi:hypothetical protein
MGSITYNFLADSLFFHKDSIDIGFTKESDERIEKELQVFHELNEVQVQKIRQKVDYVNKQVFVNSLIGIGGLAGSFSTGGFSLLATALALGKGYKDFVDYKEKVKENPSYLLWKIKKN